MLSQAISTTAGYQYQVTFDYSRRIIVGGVGPGVDIDGSELANYSIIDSNWVTEVLLFTATGASTTIAFRSEINGTDFDARIDNVNVVLYEENGGGETPAPGTVALLGLGFAGLGYQRRKQNKAA